jgi:hypothetical protein
LVNKSFLNQKRLKSLGTQRRVGGNDLVVMVMVAIMIVILRVHRSWDSRRHGSCSGVFQESSTVHGRFVISHGYAPKSLQFLVPDQNFPVGIPGGKHFTLSHVRCVLVFSTPPSRALGALQSEILRLVACASRKEFLMTSCTRAMSTLPLWSMVAATLRFAGTAHAQNLRGEALDKA